MEKDGLEGVELHGPVGIVRRNHQKQDSSDETEEIAQRAGSIISQSRTPRGWCRSGRWNSTRAYSSAPFLADWTLHLRPQPRPHAPSHPSVPPPLPNSVNFSSPFEPNPCA